MAKIAIIGSGFVGQANGKALAKFGHEIIFTDIDGAKLEALAREGYRAITPDKIEQEFIDVFFICVPTPTTEAGAKLTFIQDAAKLIGIGALRRLDNYPIVAVKSTVLPGTTRGIVLPILEQYSDKKAGRDFGVAFEPEYLRERVSTEDAEAPKLVLIGSDDPHAASFLAWLRAPFRCPIEQVSLEEAEVQKYVHNLFNASKITFFNEMRTICKRLGVDAEKIFPITAQTAEASWNPNYGIRDFGPYDGSCLPKDTAAFLLYAKEKLGHDMPLLSAVIAINQTLEKEEAERGSKGGMAKKEAPSLPSVRPAFSSSPPPLFSAPSSSPSPLR